ncbi:molybdopterin molybdotransferase MoeA [Hirschia maritima]|uniref:molybdopterin molybdotransferase MoeA n=1 Tax=Hirschia maritima TaxID=1121961 RepID=UPI00037FA4E6|nr:gephyrin-like molybdotransferase Glp [Hirschia maritima]
MLSTQEALKKICTVPQILDSEIVELHDAEGRILNQSVKAKITQPPSRMSAMDGYAVRFEDCERTKSFNVVGESSAGSPFNGSVNENECVRIFTGSVVPDGANHVVLQENTERKENKIQIMEPQERPRNVRAAGVDFNEGDVLFSTGTKMTAHALSICAAANHGQLSVLRKPRVGILSNGNELKKPGSTLNEGEIIASNEYALRALVQNWGAEPVLLGTARDTEQDIIEKLKDTEALDIIIPIGGASVGDYDLVKPVIKGLGFEPVFSKVAVKPGKPTWFSTNGNQYVLGLPGNPASAIVCAHLFVKPLISQLLGIANSHKWIKAKLVHPLKENGRRECFDRANLTYAEDGTIEVSLHPNQDSSLLKPFINSDVILNRPANDKGRSAGDLVNCLLLNN